MILFLLQSRSVWIHSNSFCHYAREFNESRKFSVLSTAEHLTVNEDEKSRSNRTMHGSGGGREGCVNSEMQRCQSCRQRPAKGLCSHCADQFTSVTPLAAAAAQSLWGFDLQRRNRIKLMLEKCKLFHPDGNNLKCWVWATAMRGSQSSAKNRKQGSTGTDFRGC